MSPTALAARLSLIMFLLFLVTSVHWTVRGEYEIVVGDEHVDVRLSTILTQNLTSIPVFSVDVNAQGRPDITEIIEQAVKSEDSSVVLQDWSLHVESNGTRILLDGSIRLGGMISTDGGGTRVDLSWINFDVTQDFLDGNYSLNLVGRSYLLDRAVTLASRQTFPVIQVIYELNGVTRSHVDLRNDIDGLGLLDFSFVPVPLERWTFRYEFGDGSSTWTNEMGLKFEIRTNFFEDVSPGTEPSQVRHIATYEFHTKVLYPGLASAEGDRIIARLFVEEMIMGTVVIGLLGVLGAGYVVERRVGRSRVLRRRSAKK